MATLQGSDEAVAPNVDPALAARRVAQADVAALRAPNWLKRVLARHRG
jgi:hypothetical protein